MALVAWVGKKISKPSKVLETALVDEKSIIKMSGTSYSWTFVNRSGVGRFACYRDACVIVDAEIKSQDRSSDDVEIGSKISILTMTPSFVRKLISLPSNWMKSERVVETSRRFTHCLWSQGLG
jgi:hypothetical protein